MRRGTDLFIGHATARLGNEWVVFGDCILSFTYVTNQTTNQVDNRAVFDVGLQSTNNQKTDDRTNAARQALEYMVFFGKTAPPHLTLCLLF